MRTLRSHGAEATACVLPTSFQLDPTIAAISALLVLVSIVALGFATLLQRRAPA